MMFSTATGYNPLVDSVTILSYFIKASSYNEAVTRSSLKTKSKNTMNYGKHKPNIIKAVEERLMGKTKLFTKKPSRFSLNGSNASIHLAGRYAKQISLLVAICHSVTLYPPPLH